MKTIIAWTGMVLVTLCSACSAITWTTTSSSSAGVLSDPPPSQQPDITIQTMRDASEAARTLSNRIGSCVWVPTGGRYRAGRLQSVNGTQLTLLDNRDVVFRQNLESITRLWVRSHSCPDSVVN